MNLRKTREDILQGSVVRILLVLAGPLVFNQLVQILYNLIDTFWLGRLGRAAVSAPIVAWPIILTVTMFGRGFASAGLALVSQYVGANRWDKVNRVVGNLITFLGFLSVLVAIFGFVFAGDILRLIRAPADIFQPSLLYLSVIFAAIPFLFIGFIFSMVMRAIGDTITPMEVNIFVLTLNAVLDPMFIFGFGPIPALGVEGAAIATAISGFVSSIIAVIILFKGWKQIHVHLRDFVPEVGIISKIVNIGSPAAVGNSLNGLAFAAVMVVVVGFGSIATAAYGITMRIINVVSSIAFGIAQATSIMIGQNIGAEQYTRAKYILGTAIKISFTTMAVLAVLLFVLRNSLIQIFISDESVVLAGSSFMFFFSLSVPFFGIFFPVMQSLKAAGKTKRSAALAFTRLWLLRVPLAYVFSVLWASMLGIWFGVSLANVIIGLISLHFLVNTKWVKKVID